MIRVLFVCLGNICRSPTAHGLFRDLVNKQGLSARIGVDSAGTSAFHQGDAPDRRSVATAKRRGVDLSDIRSRPVVDSDFDDFDYILAMDDANHGHLLRQSPLGQAHKIHLFLAFAPQIDRHDVPDPYYGGPNGFDDVMDMVEAASAGLLTHIVATDLGDG